jgi:hypothetical protein
MCVILPGEEVILQTHPILIWNPQSKIWGYFPR